MIGTLVNVAAIVGGSIVGLFLREKFPERIQKIVLQGISLAVLLIGLQMAMSVNGSKDILIVIFSLVLGGIAGEIMSIENRLDQLGNYLKSSFNTGQESLFVQGFVHASLIYCVGAMAIMGAINDGLNNDPSILFTKSVLDGTTAIAFTATFGIGVMFSALPVLFYQGGISLLASWAQQILREPVIRDMTATGGLLIFAIGLNMLGASKIKVGNLLPAIFVAVGLALLVY